MLRYFYRLMVVAFAALTATATTGCAASDYGIPYIPFDEDTVDGEVPDTQTYGCPSVNYHIEGIVTDGEGTPLEGIEARMIVEYYFVSANTTATGGFLLDTTTDQRCQELTSLDVEVRDVDGSEKGEYQSKTVSVPLTCSGYEGERECTNTDVKIELEEVVPDNDVLLSDDDTPTTEAIPDDDTLISD